MFVLKEVNNIFEEISSPFDVNSNERLFHQQIGISENENEYINKIFHLTTFLKEKNAIVYQNELPKIDISSKVLSVKNSFKFKDLSQVSFVFKKAFNIISSDDSQKSKQRLKAFTDVCNLWYIEMKNNKKPITFDMVVNFSIKLSYWFNDIKNKIQESCQNYILYFGNIKEHEIYFLKFMFNIGFNIVFINTQSFNNLILDKFTTRKQETNQKTLNEIPCEEIVVPCETNSFKAQSEYENINGIDSSTLVKWQLEDYLIKNVPLRTTYDELFSLWNVEANFRPGFKTIGKSVYLPSIVCKISGVPEELGDFKRKIEKLKEGNLTIYFDSVLEFCNSLSNNTSFDISHMSETEIMHLGTYKYSHLRDKIQTNIISSISKTLSHHSNITTTKNSSILTSLGNQYTKVFQNYDFGFEVPKIVVLNQKNEQLNSIATIVLEFLYYMGFDIVFITPTGYLDIEKTKIKEINIFQLETFLDDNEYESNSFKLRFRWW